MDTIVEDGRWIDRVRNYRDKRLKRELYRCQTNGLSMSVYYSDGECSQELFV